MNRTTVAAAILALGLMLPATYAESRQHGKADKLKQALQLTDDQTNKITAILREAYGSREEMKKLSKDERRELVKNKRPDVQKKIREVLTAEQREKFDAMQKNRKKHRD